MTSTDVEAIFDRAAKRLRGVERGKMLSATGLRDPKAGKFFAFTTRGQLVEERDIRFLRNHVRIVDQQFLLRAGH